MLNVKNNECKNVDNIPIGKEIIYDLFVFFETEKINKTKRVCICWYYVKKQSILHRMKILKA